MWRHIKGSHLNSHMQRSDIERLSSSSDERKQIHMFIFFKR